MRSILVRCFAASIFFNYHYFVLPKLLTDVGGPVENFLDDDNVITSDSEKSGMTVEEKELIFTYFNRHFISGERIFIKNVTEDKLKTWRNGSKLKIITHGWLSSDKSPAVDSIKNAYLTQFDINVITVDWSESASWKAYPLPAYMTKQVGAFVALLIEDLVKERMVTFENIHVIGHSLGSHVAGATGAAVTTGRIARITGLDPAGPAFEFVHYATNNVLDKSDAEFVDIIHTAGGAAGFYQAMGHADFYPNGGTPTQPGCSESSNVKGYLKSFGCSHGKAYDYFADSILHPHTYKAVQCNTWKEFDNGSCDGNAIAYMGDETPHTTVGIFYLRTAATPPYGLQQAKIIDLLDSDIW